MRGTEAGRKKQLLFFSGVFIFLLLAGVTGAADNNVLRYGFRIFLYITIGEMWNLLSGCSGMTSLGQQTFIGLSGYTLAIVTTTCKLPYAAGIIAGTALSTLAALVLSLLLLRIDGMYFAITTWVVAEALETFFLSWTYVNRGAGMTVTAVPYPGIGQLYVMALILCAVSLILVKAVLGSKLGTGIMAMRDDMQAAEASEVNVKKCKREVYIIAAAFTALAGSLFFLNKGTIYPESGFDIGWTISMVFIVIIGGSGTIEGPVAGAVVYVLLSEFLARYPGWSNIILGTLAIIMILFCPRGIVRSGIAERIRKRLPVPGKKKSRQSTEN